MQDDNQASERREERDGVEKVLSLMNGVKYFKAPRHALLWNFPPCKVHPMMSNNAFVYNCFPVEADRAEKENRFPHRFPIH